MHRGQLLSSVGRALVVACTVVCCKAWTDVPAASIFGEELQLRDASKESQQFLTVTARAFMAGDYKLDIANAQESGNTILETADESPWGDRDTNPINAMQTDLEFLLKRFETVQGALVTKEEGAMKRRYFVLRDLNYWYDTALLNMTVTWTEDEEEVKEIRPSSGSKSRSSGSSSSSSSSKRRGEEQEQEEPEDPCLSISVDDYNDEDLSLAQLQHNCRLTLALDIRLDGVVELQQGDSLESSLSVAEKLRTCSDYRVVQLTCNGPACRTKLYAAGIHEGWPAGSTGFHNLVSANDCCELMMICREELASAFYPVQCEMRDDGSRWWGISVGDPERYADIKEHNMAVRVDYTVRNVETYAGLWEVGVCNRPSPIDWQAACQPTCVPMPGDNSIDPDQWRPCRYERQRCQVDCRCSWFC